MTAPRLEKILHQDPLLVVAFDGHRPVGFKFGYVVKENLKFFSWLGGVDSEYRRRGIGQALLDFQEQYVKNLGIPILYFTSFDRFPAMIALGKKNMYVKVRTAEERGEKKYWFEKHLL